MSFMFLSFFGGEPLLSWNKYKDQFIEIKNIADTHNCFYSSSITTNGYLLNTIDLNDFIKINLNEIHVTFDCDKKSHDQLRKTKAGRDSFDTIIKNLQKIKEHFIGIDYNIKIVIRINLLNNSMHDVVDFLSNFDESDKRFFYFKPVFNTTCFCVANANKNDKVIKTGSTIMWDPSGRNNVCPDKK